MKSLKSNLVKIGAGLSFCLAYSLLSPANEAKANACDGTAPLTSACYITPTTYKITVYEMGLCTSDPLAGTYLDSDDEIVTDNTIDESSCTATFQSSSGSTVNLGSGTATLTGTDIRPPAGTYPHAYIKLKNTFGLKGSYTHDGTLLYSTSSGGTDTDSTQHAEFDEDLMDFDNGSTCGGTPVLAASEVFTSSPAGTMKAVLAQVSGSTYVGDSSCGSSTRLFGSFAPSSSIVIAETTAGLEVNFTITNKGMTIIPDGSGGVASFAGGPFAPKFETY